MEHGSGINSRGCQACHAYLLMRPLRALSMVLLRSSPHTRATYKDPSLSNRL